MALAATEETLLATTQRIVQRLEEEVASRNLLRKILSFCQEERTVEEIENEFNFWTDQPIPLHTPRLLLSWLIELGGLGEIIDKSPPTCLTTAAGRAACKLMESSITLPSLLSRESEFHRIYLFILKICLEPKNTEEIEKALAAHPEAKQSQLHPGYFITRLEKAAGLEWSGKWRTVHDGEKPVGLKRHPLRTPEKKEHTSSPDTLFQSSFTPAQGKFEDRDSHTKIIKTNCRGCTGDCGVLAHVKNNRVIKLEGNPEFERSEGTLCAKGLAGIHALYNPNRLKYPMERVGARGENKWKRISWTEAIDKIARKLMEIRDKYGAESILASTGGGGNPNFYSTARFCDVFGTPNWFEPGAAQCYLPRMLMYGMTYGGGPLGNSSLADSNCLEAYFYNETKMKCFVLWGTCPSYSGPSQAGRALVELRARGVKTVVIDPRFTPDASKAEVWLPIRPGTDVALALCWIRAIIDKELYDKDFILKWSNLPYLVNTETGMHLRASELMPEGAPDTYVVWDEKTHSARPVTYPWDDQLSPCLKGSFTIGDTVYKPGFQLLKERVAPWSFAKTAETCWLDKDMIEKGLLLYAKHTPSSISLGVATDQSPNSTQAAHAAATLDILLGNIEKPGTVLQRYDDLNVGRELRTSPLQKFLPEKQLQKRLGGTEHKGLLHWWTANPSAILRAITEGKPYQLRAWIERSGNKLGTVANAGAWAEGMKKLELVVHFFMYPTSFSSYADFILPASEWLETDFPVNSFNRMYARQATTQLFESANETWFWAQLAKRCAELGHENCRRAFDPKETAPELPYFESYGEELDAWSSKFGMNWEEFKDRTPFEFNSLEKWRRYHVYKETDPQTGLPRGFNTPSQKCEVYLESLITLGRTGHPWTQCELKPANKDYDPLPYYLEPAENPNNDTGENFPLVMTSGRLPYWHQTTLRNVSYLREIAPVAEILINPGDAGKYGVDQEDWLWVESMRGRIKARASISQAIARGVVQMERFWNPETLNTPSRGFREMNVNILSKSDPPHNDVCGTYTLRGYQVKIYRADGPPPGIWQEPEDFKPWLPQPTEPTQVKENDV